MSDLRDYRLRHDDVTNRVVVEDMSNRQRDETPIIIASIADEDLIRLLLSVTVTRVVYFGHRHA